MAFAKETADVERQRYEQSWEEINLSVIHLEDRTPFSLFPRFFPIHFSRFVRRIAGKPRIVMKFSDFVVRLRSNDEKTTLQGIKIACTILTLDEDNHVINAKNTALLTVKMAEKWTEDVRKEISKVGLDVFRGAVVHVGLKASVLKEQIEKKYPDVACELNRERLTLLLYSKFTSSPDILEKATAIAKLGRPDDVVFREFTSPSGILVCLCLDDITKVFSDSVVSLTDVDRSMGADVSQAIFEALDPKLKGEIEERLTSLWTSGETKVLVTSGLPLWKTILHARWPSCKNEAMQETLLTQSVYNCFNKAKELKHDSIALTFFSPQKLKVSPEICAQSYKAGLDKFDREARKSGPTSLKKILFVDPSLERLQQIERLLYERMRPVSTLRLVLVGKTGVGKSSTGNSILGRSAFKSEQRLKAVTTVSRLEKVLRPNVCIEVVDSPGFLGDDDPEHIEKNSKEILKTVALSLPGPHAFLLIFRGNDRFSKSEIAVCKLFKKLFSDNTNLMQFVIVVFTYIESKEQLDQRLRDSPDYLKTLLEVCCGRVVGINNITTYATADRPYPPDIERLVHTALDLRDRNLGQFYSNDLTRQCLQLLQSGEHRGQSLEGIKQEIMLGGEENAMTRLTTDPKAQQEANKFLGCTFL